MSELTKANKTNAISAILEIALQSTAPFSAVGMARELREQGISLTVLEVAGLIEQLTGEGKLWAAGIIEQNGEVCIGYIHVENGEENQ